MPRTRSALAATFLALLALPAAAASGQPRSAADLEARLRVLEARVAALEGRGEPAGPAAASSGPACRKLSLSGAAIPPGGTLTVTVNGAIVGTYDKNALGDLEGFMRPGPNRIGLAFAAPGTATTEAQLRCLPPGPNSLRTTILHLKPTPGRLTAETVVELSRP